MIYFAQKYLPDGIYHPRILFRGILYFAAPADYVRERVRLLFRRGCHAGQHRKTRHSIRGAVDGGIMVIIGNRPTAVPSTQHQERRDKCQRVLRTLMPAVCSSDVQRVDRQQATRPVIGDNVHILSLYVISGGARPGRARSNDLAERHPPWLSFFFYQKE